MKPSVGRIVHYVDGQGQHLAAIMTSEGGSTRTNVGLTVFVRNEKVVERAYDVPIDEGAKAPGTWHWPERED